MNRFGVLSLAIVFAGPLGCKTRCCPPGSLVAPKLDECGSLERTDRLGRTLLRIAQRRGEAWLEGQPSEGADAPAVQESSGALPPRARTDQHPTILALSGGALNGAFGAGFLNGWYERDDRPRFDTVTGVSTGGVQAPFVFLDDDHGASLLNHYFTNYEGSDILRDRWMLTVPFSSSTMIAEGLERLIATWVNADFLRRISAAARDGEEEPRRALLVGTVEFDTGAFHAWDMVKIADAGDVCRFRQVLMASASAPPLYPPVMIDGHPHFDGGVRQQIFIPCLIKHTVEAQAMVFAALTAVNASAKEAGHATQAKEARFARSPVGPPIVYMVVNSYMGVELHCTQPQVLDIGLRAVTCLGDESLSGNVWKAWGILQKAWAPDCPCEECFHLVSMPRKYAAQGTGSQALTLAHVRFLYAKGHEMGLAAEGWVHQPEELLELQTAPVYR